MARVCKVSADLRHGLAAPSAFCCVFAPGDPFICFALSSGIPPQVVMKWTGHSDYQAMKPYIEIAEKTKAVAMKFFEQEMER